MALPLTLSTVVNLPSLGINSNSYRFGVLTMESDRYVCIKDQQPDGSFQVVVIDLHNNNALTRKPMKAESALMNPADNIMALRGVNEGESGSFAQVFNLNTKEKLAHQNFTESIVFWKWVSNSLIVVVTETYVYHWNVLKNDLVQIMERSGKLAEQTSQIINYHIDNETNPQWVLLCGLYTHEERKNIEGSLQLYSIDRKQHQLIDGHAGCFADIIIEDNNEKKGLVSFVQRDISNNTSKLVIINRPGTSANAFKVMSPINYGSDKPNDFPIYMTMSEELGLMLIVTKLAQLLVFDIASATMIFKHSISPDPVFLATAAANGVLVVTRKGVIHKAIVNDKTLIQYMQQHLSNSASVASSLALRYGYSGCDDMFIQLFDQAFKRGDYKSAAMIASKPRSGCLRTANIIAKFSNVASDGGANPLMVYFSTLLECGTLNKIESVELVRIVLNQGRKEFVEKWLRENKLECSQELGDLLKAYDPALALAVYQKSNSHNNVIQILLSTKRIEELGAYMKQNNYVGDFDVLLRTLTGTQPDAIVPLVRTLLENPTTPPLIDVNQVMSILLQTGKYNEVIAIGLDYCKTNTPDQAALQTKIMQLAIQYNKQMAEAIFQANSLSHYDRNVIANECERCGMYNRALENSTDITAIRRILLNSSNINIEWLGNYLVTLSNNDYIVDILCDLLKASKNNTQTVVQLAIRFTDKCGAAQFIKIFETQGCFDGLFFYLGSIIATSMDPLIHFKYIETATKLNNFQEVDRICRESIYYNPEQVKDFLKDARLADPRPLIFVCDKYNFVEEMTEYLYKQNLLKYIEIYVLKVNSMQAPYVLGTLLELDCPEDVIVNLLMNLRGCNSDTLIEEMEKRSRLKLLLPWLEMRISEGSQETAIYNAIAKIYIDLNKDAENFLKNNIYYDPKVIGRYCEDIDPHLSCIAYKKLPNECDDDLIRVTSANGLFRILARICVERKNPLLWSKVLSPEYPYRDEFLIQVTSTALPESNDADEISVAVKAFMAAEIPNQLIDLLEKIVFHNSDFSSTSNLQSLLIVTAIKFAPEKVLEYINRLDKYDAHEIGKIAISDQYRLYEEAYAIHHKFQHTIEAATVLIKYIQDIHRSLEFANRVNDPQVWKMVGDLQLENDLVEDSIHSYIKAENANDHVIVTLKALTAGSYEPLIKYLKMARGKVRDAKIDSDIIYCYAKLDQLSELEAFVTTSNVGSLPSIGDRLFDEKMYAAAKIIYTIIPNNAKLALCNLSMDDFSAAIEACKKAKNPKIWKDVCITCCDKNRYDLAVMAAEFVVLQPDHLEEIIQIFERDNKIKELLTVMENSLSSDKAHIGLFTELGILIAKHECERLEDYIKKYMKRINLPKLIRACEKYHHWKPVVSLYIAYDDYDQACSIMMNHSPVAFEIERFMEIVVKVSNIELIYNKMIPFFLEEYPLQLNQMLMTVGNRIDPSRVITILRKQQHLPLCIDYLKSVQGSSHGDVTECLIELYLDSEDLESLTYCIENFHNYDELKIAKKLQNHDLSSVRNLGAQLYKKNSQHEQAMSILKKENNYKDLIQTAKASKKEAVVEELLRTFAEKDNKECFTAMLYVCYDLIQPDVVMEIAWLKKWDNAIMPYRLQYVKQHSQWKKDIVKKLNNTNSTVEAHSIHQQPLGFNNHLALTNFADWK